MTVQKVSEQLWLSRRIEEGPVKSDCFLPVFFRCHKPVRETYIEDKGA